MKTIVNCTICGVACIDSFTMLHPQCTRCGGDCEAIEGNPGWDLPTDDLNKGE